VVWTGLIWLRIGPVGASCEYVKEHLGSSSMDRIQGFCCKMKLCQQDIASGSTEMF
jgi:hypothetical protein